MTLRHFRIFICVCEEHGMTRAADKLLMTQPSVSQVIQEMEKHYGIRIFERLGRRLFLTQAGQELLGYARQVVQLDLQTEAAMRTFAARHRLRIGASITIGEIVFVELLTYLKKEQAELEIFSEIHNTAELEEMVLTDVLDLALVEGEIQSAYLVETPFLEDELIFVDTPQHGIKPWRTKEEMERESFFVREEGSGTRKLFEQEMRAQDIVFKTAGVYNTAEGIKKAVRAGLGVTVISKRAVEADLRAGTLMRFQVPGVSFKRNFRIIYHRNKYISADLRKVIAACGQLEEILHGN
jgi:LysR family transcriptional regulator, transcriptional activator of the cysJI operon